MPYSSLTDLPSSVKNVLPKHGQEIYFSAFNAAYEGTCKDRDDRDTCAAKIAWAAVSKMYVNKDGDWVSRKDEAARDPARRENVTNQSEQTFVEAGESIPSRFISDNGEALIKVISPGWGSSGYYSKSILERDAAKVYKPGTHMHIDHPTVSDDKDRPERSLTTLAGTLITPGEYRTEGPYGEGVYAKARVFRQYRDFLNEVAPAIGVSHRAFGSTKTGEAEGKKGPIIEGLTKCASIDFVTLAGRGGALLPLYESWREAPAWEKQEATEGDDPVKETEKITIEAVKADPALMKELREAILKEQEETTGGGEGEGEPEPEMSEMDKLKKRIAELEAENEGLKAEIARMKERESVGEAMRIAAVELQKTALPEITRARLMESMPRHVTLKEGKLDETAFLAALKETVKTESDYIAKLTGTGQVRGFGGTTKGADGTGKTVLKESFKSTFLAAGMSEEEAEKKATIAAEGR